MLLSITTTHKPATDLGYLLHKNPDRFQSFDLAFGKAHVFYPEATDERCTATLLLDVDPVGLVRGRPGEAALAEQYVNDRPYVASSFLSVAIGHVYRNAMSGRSKDRQELADAPIPLLARLPVLPSRGGEPFLRRLFEPLGYSVRAERLPLDERFPQWGESRYFGVELEATCRLRDLLSHLYVLIPVLDDDKHYWVGKDEIEKLLRRGEGWLQAHPELNVITRRYLAHQRSLAREALVRLSEGEDLEPDKTQEAHAAEEAAVEERISSLNPAGGSLRPAGGSLRPAGGLHTQRLGAVLAAIKGCGAKRVLDLGCGEGQLLRLLLEDRQFERIVGMDVSRRSLERASERLHLDRMPERQRARIELIQGTLSYRDRRLEGFDAAAVVEVIEHLDPPRLAAFERVVFEFARPAMVALTTPNVEYNVRFETLPAGSFRHRDHRFEWTREQFETWARGVAERFGYAVRFLPVGPEDPEVGAPTQMGVFTRD